MRFVPAETSPDIRTEGEVRHDKSVGAVVMLDEVTTTCERRCIITASYTQFTSVF
jgi:hypothetical protein